MTILIDNGHGRETPGKRSPDGQIKEYEYTREMAQTIVSRLNSLGLSAQKACNGKPRCAFVRTLPSRKRI